MGFLWEGSTGARAVKYLRSREQGTELETNDLAAALDVKAGALYQLLANAVRLRFIRKVPGPGQSIRWKLGAAGDSVTIERRPSAASLSLREIERRRATNEVRRRRSAAMREAESSVRSGRRDAVDPSAVATWVGGLSAELQPVLRAHLAKQQCRRPAKYLARWHVLYRDERGQVHGDIQVQAVHADLGVVDAWCPARGGVDRLELSGFARISDADSGERLNLQAWLELKASTKTLRRGVEMVGA
jgi:hypothetical protein